MSRPWSCRLALGSVLAWLGVCSCNPEPQPAPAASAPWPARPSLSASTPARVVVLPLASESQLSFEVPSKKLPIRGTVRVLKGELRLSPGALAQSTAELEVDLGSLRVEEPEDAGQIDRSLSSRAQAWLNLGVSLPEAELARRRWARFKVETLKNVRTSEGASGSGAAAPAQAQTELTVHADAIGSLLLNDHRVSYQVPIAARLSTHAAQDPVEVAIETTRPIELALTDHDIRPRDAFGVFQPEEARRSADLVGRSARVTTQLVFRRPGAR